MSDKERPRSSRAPRSPDSEVFERSFFDWTSWRRGYGFPSKTVAVGLYEAMNSVFSLRSPKISLGVFSAWLSANERPKFSLRDKGRTFREREYAHRAYIVTVRRDTLRSCRWLVIVVRAIADPAHNTAVTILRDLAIFFKAEMTSTGSRA